MVEQLTDVDQRLKISSGKLAFFRLYVRRFIRKNFHAVRLLGGSDTNPFDKLGPVVVVANHASWWDPMVSIFLGHYFAKEWNHFAPIEQDMLEKYDIFKKLGFFAVKKESARGLRQFMECGKRVLESDSSVLWMTPEGEFRDPRVRPVEIKKGLGHLLAKSPNARVVPLALEYVFWNERQPEVMLSFGEEVKWEGKDPEEIQRQLEIAMERNQDTLAHQVMKRDEGAFQALQEAGSGVSGVYGLWQRWRGHDKHHQSL